MPMKVHTQGEPTSTHMAWRGVVQWTRGFSGEGYICRGKGFVRSLVGSVCGIVVQIFVDVQLSRK